MGIYINLSSEFADLLVEMKTDGTPSFVRWWAQFLKVAMPSVGPIGAIAGLAVMKRSDWGRKAMTSVLGVGFVAILVFAGFWFRDVIATPDSQHMQFGNTTASLLVGGIVVFGIQLAGIGGSILYLKKLKLKEG